MYKTVSLIGFAFFLVACGGGSNPLWNDHDATYQTLEPRDGFVRSDGVTLAAGGGPIVGDLDGATPGLGVRVFYSFDTSGIPSDARIDSATLMVYQESAAGTPGSGAQGDLLVDQVEIGAALNNADWNGGTVDANIGTLSTDAVSEWKSLDVAAAVQESVTAGRVYTEFRLHFTVDSNGNGVSDYIRTNDGADSRATGHIPHLIVHYRTPIF